MTLPATIFDRIIKYCDGNPLREDMAYLEQALWNNQNIPRTKSDIAVDIPVPDQIVEMDGISVLLTLGSTNQHGIVPCRISGKTSDRDHRIKHRHVRAIRECSRLRGFTDNADSVGNRTDKAFP